MDIGSIQAAAGTPAMPGRAAGPAGGTASERTRADLQRAAAAQQQAAASNLDNAAAMLRTADGWLGTIQDMMGRMGELAVRAGDGTLSGLDRRMLQQEFAQMQQGIQAITTGPDAMARYNGLPLFQGETVTLAPGAAYTTPDLTASSQTALGAGGTATWGGILTRTDITTPSGAAAAVPALNLGLDHLGSLRSGLGAIWSLVSPSGAPLNPSATAAATLADELQYTTFHQTLNALGSGSLLMQA